jgi:competence protein ComEA
MDGAAPWRALEESSPKTVAEEGSSGPNPRPLILAIGGLVAVCLIAMAAFVASRPGGQMQVVGASGGQASWQPSPSGLVVEVSGAVMRPGIYTLPPGARVGDAIAAAGGYSPDVDPTLAEQTLNLAAKVQDAEAIRVPRRGDAASAADAAASDGAVIDLNTATAAQLDTLPGIGPATAAKIVAARQQAPFTAVDDLVSRKLVSASVLAGFRDRVTV